MNEEVIEGSREARAYFDDLYKEAVLFTLPYDPMEEVAPTDTPAGELIKPIAATAASWIERAIMPYGLVATQAIKIFPDLVCETNHLYEIVDGTLIFLSRRRYQSERGNLVYYSDSEFRNGQDVFRMRPTDNLDQTDLDSMAALAITGLASLTWLLDALTSSEYSAKETSISRQLSRSTREPRRRYEIVVRPRGSAEPTMRQQFAEVVRIAHAVRGHLRTDYRTGMKTIKVRPHIRGRGDAVQVKDYVVKPKRAESKSP